MVIKLKELIGVVDYYRYRGGIAHDSDIEISLLKENINDGVLQTVLTFTAIVSSRYDDAATTIKTVEIYPKDDGRKSKAIEISSRDLTD